MAEVSGFSEFLNFMAGADAFTLLLPFLLSWMVYYIALSRVDFLFDGNGDSNLQNLPPVLALIMAFFTARFIVLNPFYQAFFIEFFGKITVGVIGILGLFTLLAFAGYQSEILKAPALGAVLVMMAGAAFVASGGFGPPLINSSGALAGALAYANTAFVWLMESGAIWGIVILGTIWYIMRPEPDNDDNGPGLMDVALNPWAFAARAADLDDGEDWTDIRDEHS